MDIKDKKDKLIELVNQFQSNIKQYKSSIYDEANTRVDFIDKFFTLLDWDVANNQGYSEQYREVVREDKIQIEGKQKAPDYSFRIGKERKFFVEAKKPSIFIKEDIAPAYQIRRYGYTAKLPLSILTDFEEFAIYDTRIKPDKNDKASVGRVFYCTYDEYEKHFDFIYDTFSKSAILKGSFDKYTEENKNKKGTGEVDKELLKLVEEWRTELAKNIALRNNDIDIYNLNNAVQKIIDRIIFLRIAEDKEIESYENLLNLTKIPSSSLTPDFPDHVGTSSRGLVYQRLNNLFITANNKYNAGLFQPENWLQPPSTPDFPDPVGTSSRGVRIDDKVLTSIIKGLYYPECPYEFSILPIEILGNIYEQFLGKTIKFRNVKDGHTAIIEEKPEVRKAGGVYYTPQYIVNYIVENTIGFLLNRTLKDSVQIQRAVQSPSVQNTPMSPDEISKLRICDPACGSGSFLVGAYQYLLNYHLDYWTNESFSTAPLRTRLKKALKEEKIYQVSENNYKLTIEEKQKILINNIYGVDIDPQAVEVTKLSLYLKLLENESKESEGYLFKHTDFKLLPSLDNNIKCGNSLIGSDFYTSQVTHDLNRGLQSRGLFPDLETMRKVNVFDWDKQFPEIFGKGRKKTTEDTENTEGEKSGFDVVIGNPPWVSLTGKFGNDFLTDNEFKYLSKRYNANTYMPNLYEYFIWKGLEITNNNGFFSLIVPDRLGFNDQFLNLRKYILNNFTIINLYYKAKFPNIIADTLIFNIKKNQNNENYEFFVGEFGNKPQNKQIKDYFNSAKFIFSYESNNDISNVISKIDSIKNKKLLSEIFDTTSGFGGNSKEIFNERKNNKQIEILRGRNIEKYFINGLYYFEFIKKNITGRTTDKTKLGAKEKILLRKTGYPLFATYDNSGIFPEQSLYFLFNKNKEESYLYYLGIINSKVFQFYYWNKLVTNRASTPQLKKVDLDIFPLPIINFSIPIEKDSHDRLVSLVDNMLETQKLYHNAQSDSYKNLYKQKIDLIDNQIDDLVYKLYDLTEDEIKIVEGV